MPARRPIRGLKAAQATAPTTSRLLSTQTLTLVASWKGQLVICTVVLVVGAIYFAVREPIREWKERQRERMSRAFTEELLSMEKDSAASGASDRHRSGSSTVAGSSTAVATAKAMNARERGREKRKEKKRKEHSQNANDSTVVAPHDAGSTARPSLPDRSLARIADPPSGLSAADASDPSATTSSSTSAGPQVPTSNAADAAVNLHSSTARPKCESAAPPSVEPLTIPDSRKTSTSLSSPRKTCAERGVEPPSSGVSDRRDSYSSSHSRSYSIIPDPSYLPPQAETRVGKKKKRQAKNRPALSPQQPQQQLEKASNARAPAPSDTPTAVSGDSPNSQTLPVMSPDLIRRRVKSSGIELPPEIDALLDTHEFTIDSLRAEIGRATAEECKARDDEVRAREELRRSRATEDRLRADYERARKTRDRAEQDARRVEGDVRCRSCLPADHPDANALEPLRIAVSHVPGRLPQAARG